MTTTTDIPYLESYGCLLATEDEGCVHEGECDEDWHCATCRRRLNGQPCLDHAPCEVPGLALVECSANPPHYLWAAANDAYGTGCPRCYADILAERHEGCDHSHHRAWQRWKVTKRLASRAYVLGIARGDTITWGGGCDGCMTGFRWGRSGYVLGKPREWWACLRRGHLYADSGLPGICDRCCPLPDDDWFATGSNR